MNDNLTSVTLDLAADAIQMAGWGQGPDSWRDSNGLCLEGGIMAAVGIPAGKAGWADALTNCPAYRAMSEYLAVSEVWTWNDAEGRTQQEVIEVLRAAAAVERVKEATASYDTADQPLPVEIPETSAA